MALLPQGLFKRKQLLSERQEALLEVMRSNLNDLQTLLERLGTDVTTNDWRVLYETLQHLDELFLLVVVGEFNSGKSSFVNALLGTSIQPEGVTPTTDHITLLRYGDEPYDEIVGPFLLERSYPAPVLRQVTIVDTPGTNAVIRRHEELTQNFVPKADLVLFTTSAERPFTESERAFLEIIKTWGKKVVVIINKADILEGDEVHQVIDFVRQHSNDVLAVTPDIFAVSARQALRSRQIEDVEQRNDLWQRSGFVDVEQYVVETLDEETRVRLKLLSPLGVAERLTKVYLEAVEERLGVLTDDFTTLDNIEQQLALFRSDLLEDVHYHLRDIDQVLQELEVRGLRFFDETLRLARTPLLVQGEKVRAAFEEEVVGDVAQQVEQRIQGLVDWTVEKNLRLWQNVTDYISRRRMLRHNEGIIGEVGGAFDYNRSALLAAVGHTAQDVVRGYDRQQASAQLTDDIQSSLTSTALTGAAGLGLGTALVALFSSLWLDVTGVLLATAAVAGGLFVLPAKRRKAKQEFSERVGEMRVQVRESIQSQFERETDQALDRIREAISPYTRFVRAKREQLGTMQRELSDMEATLERLRGEIEV